jgi:serine/threonine-protein kinase ATR
MACVQALLAIPELTEGTLTTWLTLLKTLSPADAGSYVGVTTANVLVNWSSFSADARRAAKECVEYLVCQIGGQLGEHLDDAADLNQIKELREANSAIHIARSKWPWTWKLQVIARRTYSYNHAVALQALNELKLFLIGRPRQLETISSGDMFDPLLGEIMAALYSASSRDEVGAEAVRSLAFECMGIVGAVDPDRYEVHRDDPQYVVQNNFVEEEEACSFAMHLITNVLVGTFRSTSDIQHQGHVAYAIQELLRFCDFQPAIVEGRSVPVKLRKRWQMFPKDVLEVVTPLLDAGYKLPPQQRPATSHPIYPTQTTYRVWMQTWAAHLIAKVQGAYAARIFAIFDGVVRQRDAGIAHFLLPHLVLNVLISGDADEAKNVRLEILAVLEDQVKADSDSTPEKKMLSSQVHDLASTYIRPLTLVLHRPSSCSSTI